MANQADNLFACDINNDGVEVFDLTINDPFIIGSQNPSELQLTYHLSQADAENGINTIVNPSSYVSAGNETIYARLEDMGTGDYDTTNFDLVILPNPNTINPSPIILCDDNNDGFAIFDITVRDVEISNGDPLLNITYHETFLDAQNAIFPLSSPYENIVPFSQIIHARVENGITGCYAIVPLELIVIERPQITQPENLFINEGDGDGFAIFDLTVNEAIMLAGLDPQDYNVAYFENEMDAQNNFPPFSTPTAFFNIENPQTLYVRVENVNTGCNVITTFLIATDETTPDVDGDGIANEDEDINSNGNLNDDDTDGNGIPNYLDSDDDGDTVQTIDETTGIGAGVAPSYIYIDTDGDTIENYLDMDDDGDGTLTIDEDYNNNGTPIDDDTNANGIPDFLDDAVFLSVNSFAFEDLSIYPNPTSENFTVQSSKLVSETIISIYDVQGKLLISEKIIPQNGQFTQNVPSLENGVYFVKISSEGNSVVKKLLKN